MLVLRLELLNCEAVLLLPLQGISPHGCLSLCRSLGVCSLRYRVTGGGRDGHLLKLLLRSRVD